MKSLSHHLIARLVVTTLLFLIPAGCAEYEPASAADACSALEEEGCYGPEDNLDACVRNLGEDSEDRALFDAGACATERGYLLGCLKTNAQEVCAAEQWHEPCSPYIQTFNSCLGDDDTPPSLFDVSFAHFNTQAFAAR